MIDRGGQAMHPRTRQRTLWVALALVLGVGLVALAVRPRYGSRPATVKANATRIELHSIKGALKAFELDCGRDPTFAEGLEALVADPGIEGWAGPYLDAKGAPRDPSGKPYRYLPTAEGYELWSLGPDKVDGTEDDVLLRGVDPDLKASAAAQRRAWWAVTAALALLINWQVAVRIAKTAAARAQSSDRGTPS